MDQGPHCGLRPPSPTILRTLTVLLQLPPPGRAAPTSMWGSLRLWRPTDLRHYEGVFAFTAGEHDMVAGIAQVGVGFARLALSPHTESQATAVTALLRKTASAPSPQSLPDFPRSVCL